MIREEGQTTEGWIREHKTSKFTIHKPLKNKIMNITFRESNTNSSVGAVVANADGKNINVRLSWGYTTDAPTGVNLNADYKTPAGGVTVSVVRYYLPDGTYSPVEDSATDIFDATFNAAVLELVQSCFSNYNKINIIGVEDE